MSAPTMEACCLPHDHFRGMPIPCGLGETFREAADYAPRPSDVFVASYAKCGTTWVQHIVYLLLNGGRPAGSAQEVISAIPFPEQDGFPPEGDHSSPLAFKYHLPFHLMPYSPHARYIYVARNPRDACVSYYHFLKNLPGYAIENFDAFLAAFLSGRLPYGDVLDHFAGWYDASRRLPNVLFLTYESLSRDRPGEVRRMANFLGLAPLAPDTITAVVEYSSFEFMKRLEAEDGSMRRYLEASTRLRPSGADRGAKTPTMMRKGVVGDWRNHFIEEQERRMREYIAGRTSASEVMALWRDEDVST